MPILNQRSKQDESAILQTQRWQNSGRAAIGKREMMVNPFKALREWVDRDWERRSYNPTFAFAQKLLFLSPLLLLGIVSMVIDIPPGSPGYYWGFGVAGALCLLIGVFQGWRWLLGYVRPSWHEEQARKRSERRHRSR